MRHSHVDSHDSSIQVVRPGWLEQEGARVCLVDGIAGLAGLHRAYFDEVGVGAGSFLYLAGLRATVSWASKIQCDSAACFQREGLEILAQSGYGYYELLADPKHPRHFTVTGDNTLESWSYLRRHRSARTPICSYTSGLLAGFWCLANERFQTDASNTVCWESECVASGAPVCRFEIGSADHLRELGFRNPIQSPNVRWEYQELTRRLQTTDTRLETLNQQLGMRERAYQNLIDNMNDVLLVLNRNRRVMFCNRQFLRATGMTMEESLGSSPMDRIMPEDRPAVEKIYDDLFAGRIRSATYRFRVSRPTGVVYMESSARSMTGPDGETAIELLGRDVTERELAQIELEDAHKSLLRKQQISDHDLRVAKMVHESLLPRPVDRPEISVDVKYVPVDRVGGDYCHIAFPKEHRCVLTLCDVSGHGMASALLAARVSSFLRTACETTLEPLAIAQGLNDFLLNHFADTGLFVTFLAMTMDLQSLQVSYCGAGHPGPLLLRTDGSSTVLESQNLPVGVVKQFARSPFEGKAQMSPGDRLVLYTDGITETQDETGEMLLTKGLLEIVQSAASTAFFDLGDQILEQVSRRRHGPTKDDMTLLLVEAKHTS